MGYTVTIMLSLMFSLLFGFLCLCSAQPEASPEERLPGIIDELWDKIPKDDPDNLILEEFYSFFAAWDQDPDGERWSLTEAEFVAGWGPLFGHSDNEAAAFFRMFDWTTPWWDIETVVDAADIDDIAAVIDPILGYFLAKADFNATLNSYMRGHCFAIVFNDYRTRGTGFYDDVITNDDWFGRLGSDIDTNDDDMFSR